jgi:hypothetical protein
MGKGNKGHGQGHADGGDQDNGDQADGGDGEN